MKNLRYAMALLALCCPIPARAVGVHDFFPICAALSPAQGQTLIVDTSGGRKGSYPTIAAAQTVAKGGDKIDLMTGDYGAVAIDGKNSDFITIEAAPGQTPRFTKLLIGKRGGASHWHLTGLTISGFSSGRWANGSVAHLPLVDMNNSDNIVFERNNVFSQAGDFAWQSEFTGPPDAPAVSDGLGVDQVTCVSLIENHIFNVFNGITVGGDQNGDHGKYIAVAGNIIENFAGDGIDHFASHIRIIHNIITNGHDICENKCVHTDGIQGWNWHNKPGLINTDVVIDSNVVIVQTKPGEILPADDLHGITIFDGAWDGLQISNNLIVTDTWHGITVARAKNASIVNNTIAPTNPSRRPWIKFYGNDKDPPETPYNVIIRNNVVSDMAVARRDAALPGVAIDHNLLLRNADDFADAFVKFDPEHFAYDLHPTKRSDVKGEGSSDGAPAVDIEGTPRKGKIDIGAYAYPG
jgi:hypothetical protein